MAAKKAAKKSSIKKASLAKKKVVKKVVKTVKTVKKIIKRAARKPKLDVSVKVAAPVAPTFSGTIEQYHERMRYWRQMCSQAREFIRAQFKKIDAGTFNEKAFVKEVKAMSKRWVGPKVPVKNPQRPHRSSF